MAGLGKSLVLFGVLIVIMGLLFWGASDVPILSRLGRLPGDILIRRGNFSFYFPITTAIILSIVLSLILVFLRR